MVVLFVEEEELLVVPELEFAEFVEVEFPPALGLS